MISGRVFDIQRFSIHDGPGIRTTVFLKGCPMNCRWCHNPEGIDPGPVLSFVQARCIGCGGCTRVCPKQAHIMGEQGHQIIRNHCSVCGACVQECPSGALELVGREAQVDEVMHVVARDEPFYGTSGGGMTLSGGEPTMQFDFCVSLCEAAKSRGIHCCVETCGYWERPDIGRLAGVVDLFLFDIKETDPVRHREFTGVTNEPIFRNLRALHDMGAAIILRVPVVPGLNDRPDHWKAIDELALRLPNLCGVQKMPYHPMGLSKLARFGFDLQATPEKIQPETSCEAWRG
jgi:pyruvate formate lyase activating enzyme